MNIAIDTSAIDRFFALSFDQQILIVLINVGWIPIAIAFLYGIAQVWLYWRQTLYDETLGYILLAIDIPRGNEQSPKAVENMFTYFGGAHSDPNLFEVWWEGVFQQGFSFEIACIDGYTQFLIRTPTQFRNLVESAIYSQYPDAEITEVNDYTENIPTMYPDEEYDVWGAEFTYANNEAYPIKTWPDFISEMPGKPETQFKDPMASLMDLCSSLQRGEQLWWQILVYPTGFDWVEEHQKEVKKILGESTSQSSILGDFLGGILAWVQAFIDEAIGSGLSESSVDASSELDSFKMFNLKPRDKKRLEAVQYKASKLGFLAKTRFCYVAKKEVFNKAKAVGGFVGYMKQFVDNDLNNLKPDMKHTATSTEYFFAESRLNDRKRKIVSAYKSRSGSRGRVKKIMNIEELSTLWHFPVEATVKAPLIQKAAGRKAEPPVSLPRSMDDQEKLFEPGMSTGEDIFLELDESQKNTRPNKSGKNSKKSAIASSVHRQDDEDDIFNDTESKHNKKDKEKGRPPNNLPIVN